MLVLSKQGNRDKLRGTHKAPYTKLLVKINNGQDENLSKVIIMVINWQSASKLLFKQTVQRIDVSGLFKKAEGIF